MFANCINLAIRLVALGFICFHSPTVLAQDISSSALSQTPKEFQQNGSRYFPPSTFRLADGAPDNHFGDSLAWYLRSIGEPPLPSDAADDSEVQSYRLVWIGFPAGRTVVLRLQIARDGSAKIFAKQTQYGKTELLLNKEDGISIAAVDGFLDYVKKGEFWQLSTQEYPERQAKDGSYWYLEAVRQGHYHMVYRRAPELNLGSFTDIGRYLAKDIAQLGDSTIRIPRGDRSEPMRRNRP